MKTEFINSLEQVDANDWNALAGTDQPFLRHEFLHALEESGSTGPGTGWQPRHAVLYDNGKLVAAVPLYLKTDSWGEFVFDFSWANAYHQSGLNYYPKLVSAVPFTPVSGPRFLTDRQLPASELINALSTAVQELASENRYSSWHVLFADDRNREMLDQAGLLLRKDCQFHWHNRGYEHFDDFLASLRSAKRKKLKRERRRISEAGIAFRILTADELTASMWQKIMPMYASSFLRRGRPPYLNERFFQLITARLPQSILVIAAEFSGEPIACAICFRDDQTLYGRYWGSLNRYHSLHFETCYYQGIEFCIANGLEKFEPGTQGEHKISRGFEPVETWSAHWLSHPRFAQAVDAYLDREREYTDEYMDEVRTHVPFKRETS